MTLLLLLLLGAQADHKRVGTVDFFGHKGFDANAIRAALPLRERDPFPANRSIDEWKQQIANSIQGVIGQPPTDVNMVCCDEQGDWLIYVGLPGTSSKRVRYNSAPISAVRLPPAVVKLYDEIMELSREAVMRGDSGEDRSQGYSLSADAATRAKQLTLREYALREEASTRRVLETSSDAMHREMAAEALGYARRSDRQISALVKASLDSDRDVRNNALRALSVLAEASRDMGRHVPATPLVDLLCSGIWHDRNKAVFLVEALTRAGDRTILRQIDLRTRDCVVEIAEWKSLGHNYPARMILDRMSVIR